MVDRLEAAMRERGFVKCHGGTRNELEVRREPLLDRVPHRMVGVEHVVGKLRPGLWAGVVRVDLELDAGALVAVTIGTGDGVARMISWLIGHRKDGVAELSMLL